MNLLLFGTIIYTTLLRYYNNTYLLTYLFPSSPVGHKTTTTM